jgi:hypothetical protein
MNRKIIESVDLPDGKVVVFDWSSNKEYRYQNLVCFDSDGSIRWRPQLPDNSGPDCFVGVVIDQGQIRANTMSCFALWIDPVTGGTLKSAFTK